MRWTLRSFEQLTLRELYDLLALRQRVFVVEQTCPYLDADGLDEEALHLFAHEELAATRGDTMVACLRILPPSGTRALPAIGRVVTAPEVRRTGVGRELMRRGIAATREAHGATPIRISAQRYLERFYGELGFVAVGEPYEEDGIPHIAMQRSA